MALSVEMHLVCTLACSDVSVLQSIFSGVLAWFEKSLAAGEPLRLNLAWMDDVLPFISCLCLVS